MLKAKRPLLLGLSVVLAVVVASGVAYAATRVGTEGDDTTKGTKRGDKLYGLAGNDTISGGRGYDQIYGGDDEDTIYGGSTYDALYGENGADVLYGGGGSDILNTEWPRAQGYGEATTEYAYGGSGNDHIEIDEGGYSEVYGEDGNDEIRSGDWTSTGGAPDYVDCGRGDADVVHYDVQDTLVDCEIKIPE